MKNGPTVPKVGRGLALVTGLSMLLASAGVSAAADVGGGAPPRWPAVSDASGDLWWCIVDYVIDNERVCVVGVGACNTTDHRPCAYVCVLPTALARSCQGLHPPRTVVLVESASALCTPSIEGFVACYCPLFSGGVCLKVAHCDPHREEVCAPPIVDLRSLQVMA